MIDDGSSAMTEVSHYLVYSLASIAGILHFNAFLSNSEARKSTDNFLSLKSTEIRAKVRLFLNTYASLIFRIQSFLDSLFSCKKSRPTSLLESLNQYKISSNILTDKKRIFENSSFNKKEYVAMLNELGSGKMSLSSFRHLLEVK